MASEPGGFLKVARSILRLEELGLALASPEFCAQ
jgi:hypothetical protein